MNQNGIEELLERYLAGDVTAVEKRRVETWLNETGNQHNEWHEMSENDRQRWLSLLYADIRHSINIGDGVVALKPKKLRRSIAAVAAVLIIFLTIYFGFPVVQNHLHPVQFISLSAPLNRKQQFKLSDGSLVWLNSGAKLKYSTAFNEQNREVYLSGEAYFDIKHDVTRPFIIHTNKVLTTVLGTAFDIKEDEANHVVEVTVMRGKVSVANAGKGLAILTPDQKITLNLLNNQYTLRKVDAQQEIAWLERELHFDDVTFEDAVKKLEGIYRVKIDFSNPKIKNCRFTGTVLPAEKVGNVLKVICALIDATYHTNANGSIVISGPGCDK